MHEQAGGNDGEEHSEGVVLILLLDRDLPWLWSMDELGRELGDAVRAEDAVAGLHAAGLVHRCDEFVFATRAATHFSRLSGGL